MILVRSAIYVTAHSIHMAEASIKFKFKSKHFPTGETAKHTVTGEGFQKDCGESEPTAREKGMHRCSYTYKLFDPKGH